MNTADNWISATIQSLKKASPTSLKIFLRLVCAIVLFIFTLLINDTTTTSASHVSLIGVIYIVRMTLLYYYNN